MLLLLDLDLALRITVFTGSTVLLCWNILSIVCHKDKVLAGWLSSTLAS